MAIVSPPRFMYLEANRRCNLKCQHCVFWKRQEDYDNYIPLERQQELVAELAQLNPEAKVVICGGEPMMEKDTYFGICKAVRNNNLRCLSVVNGTRIHTNEVADRMIAEGPHEVTISLDSHLEEEHDRIRGVVGAWRVATGAIERLLSARQRAGSDGRVFAMAVVHEGNYRHLDAFYDYALNDLGVDKLKLNIAQPSFGFVGHDAFFERETIKDPANFRSVVSACNSKYGLLIRDAWINQVCMYLESIAFNQNAAAGWLARKGTRDHICNTYERNIMVDLYGMARLCFSEMFPGWKLEKYGDLSYLWHEWAMRTRIEMSTCNRYCGISHSVRKEMATDAV